MIIIFGFRGRVAVISSGTFYCGQCGGDRAYVLEGVRRWFTFFFIPIFPVSAVVGQTIRCQTCQGLYREAALNIPTTDVLGELISSSFRQCAVAILKSGEPLNPHARASAVVHIREFFDDKYHYDDGVLSTDLEEADTAMIAVYSSPVANRVSPNGAEIFVSKCAEIAVVDGPLSAREHEALWSLGESFNLSDAHMTGIVDHATSSAIVRAVESQSSNPDKKN